MKVQVIKRRARDIPIQITTEFIKLESFLKLANVVESGGMAKAVIQNGEVFVNEQVCTMRGKKLRAGDRIAYGGETLVVIQGKA